MTKLLDKQFLFTQLVADLIRWCYHNNYDLTFGEAYRTPEQAALNAKRGIGISNSLHTQRLAIDLNLFINGEYQNSLEPYRPLGNYWKTLDPDCVWGGDWKSGDANHFELVV